MSRKSALGLQILMASSRHLRVVRMSRSESSSMRPTGYVSFRSLWKPLRVLWGGMLVGRCVRAPMLRTMFVERDIYERCQSSVMGTQDCEYPPILIMSPSCNFR